MGIAARCVPDAALSTTVSTLAADLVRQPGAGGPGGDPTGAGGRYGTRRDEQLAAERAAQIPLLRELAAAVPGGIGRPRPLTRRSQRSSRSQVRFVGEQAVQHRLRSGGRSAQRMDDQRPVAPGSRIAGPHRLDRRPLRRRGPEQTRPSWCRLSGAAVGTGTAPAPSTWHDVSTTMSAGRPGMAGSGSRVSGPPVALGALTISVAGRSGGQRLDRGPGRRPGSRPPGRRSRARDRLRRDLGQVGSCLAAVASGASTVPPRGGTCARGVVERSPAPPRESRRGCGRRAACR